MNNTLNYVNCIFLEPAKLKDKKSNIYSVFAANGVGKSSLCVKLAQLYVDRDIRKLNNEEFESAFDSSTTSRMYHRLNGYQYININDYTNNIYGLILSLEINNFVYNYNFSSSLQYEKVNTFDFENFQTHANSKQQELKLLEQYKKIELDLINRPLRSLHITSNSFIDNIFIHKSTSLQISNSFFGTNKLHNIGLSIELLSSLSGENIEAFINYLKDLKDFKKERLCFLCYKKSIENKIYKKQPELIYDQSFEDLLNVILVNLYSYIDIDMFNFLIDWHDYYKQKIQNEDMLKLDKFNQNLILHFSEVKTLLNKYLPGRFQDISLNKRYSSSLDAYLYDMKITDNLGNYFYSFNYINNISSEGEKKIFNLIPLFIELLCLPKNEEKGNFEYLITADDAFTSFDNANLHNILSVVYEIIKDKNSLFINFTHDYELFKIFNNEMNLYMPSIYLMNRTKKSKDVNFINFPKHNFYATYLKKKIKQTNITEEKLILILSIIPEYRYTTELLCNDADYLSATNLLHLKTNSLESFRVIINNPLLKKMLGLTSQEEKNNILKYLLNFKNYDNLLNSLFQYYIKNENENVEYRIFLSIYSRVLIEKWLIDFLKINEINFSINAINANQTGVLIDKFNNLIQNKNNYNDILTSIRFLNSTIPTYVHMNYNLLSYLINIDSSVQIKAIEEFQNHIYRLKMNKIKKSLKNIMRK